MAFPYFQIEKGELPLFLALFLIEACLIPKQHSAEPDIADSSSLGYQISSGVANTMPKLACFVYSSSFSIIVCPDEIS